MISREIAENLTRRSESDEAIADALDRTGGLDIAACETAGLAHDLGHPPFGHAGETELNRLLRNRKVREGFEGNAQSFRIVCVLDLHAYERGLDLTNVVLAGILKYPWLRPPDDDPDDDAEQKKFGAYESERIHLIRARQAVLPGIDDAEYLARREDPPQSLEASVMDLADDIAYSVHDLEDFCSQGFIDLSMAIESLDQYLARPDNVDNAFWSSARNLEKYKPNQYEETEHLRAAKRIRTLLDTINAPTASQTERDLQLRAELGMKIAGFFSALSISVEAGAASVSLRSPEWHDMQVMKRVTKQFLVGTSRMAQIQRAQRQTIDRLFVGLEHWVKHVDDDELLPETLSEFVKLQGLGRPRGGPLEAGHYRAISDYICTMSDSEAFLRAQWVSGTEIPGMANLGLVD